VGESFLALIENPGERERFLAELAEREQGRWQIGLSLLSAASPASHVSLCIWSLSQESGEMGLLGQDLGELVRDTGRLVQAEKMAGVGRIAAQLAHQLNTPLASILLSAQALEPELAGGEYEADVAILVEETRRCQRIVRRLQNFSRTPGLLDDRLNFCHLFHRVFQILGHALESAGLQLRFHIQKGRYLVRGDPSELEHAIFALIENAMDASPRGGTIRVDMKISYSEGKMWFQVCDEGEGLPEGAAQRIFEPFFTTKQEGKGTGLGLCIARRIVGDHGGGLEAKNSSKGGAEFSFSLPLSPVLMRAYREDPSILEVRAIPFEVLQARARGEFGAGCEIVGVLRRRCLTEGDR
jgi:signal transduction histidine kinase